jgi:hypothetical protein
MNAKTQTLNFVSLWARAFFCLISMRAFADSPSSQQLPSTKGFESLECRMNLAHTFPTTVCKAKGDNPSPIRVDFRRMPSWNGNADLILVEMCRYQDLNGIPQGQTQVAVSNQGELPPMSEKAVSCKRRYCTQRTDSFSIKINAIPIPFGFLVARFWIGYQEENFEVVCSEIEWKG